MNQNETNVAVRAWLNTLPGTVQDNGSDEVMRRAWGMYGTGNLEMFREALALHSFRPEPLGDTFILRLPSRPIASVNAERHRRLHNIAG